MPLKKSPPNIILLRSRSEQAFCGPARHLQYQLMYVFATSNTTNNVFDGAELLPDLRPNDGTIPSTLLNTGASLDYVISPKQDETVSSENTKPNSADILLAVDDSATSFSVDIPNMFWQNLIKEFSDVFQDQLPGLPPARNTDEIMIDTGDAKPISRPPYKTSPAEMDELRRQITELLALGLIQPHISPRGAPFLFVRKKSGELRMCVDYRATLISTANPLYNCNIDKWQIPLYDYLSMGKYIYVLLGMNSETVVSVKRAIN
ncbi:hypothetical protein [Parasitella parasitica]|uniref:Reverse transcriptase domain-containing protein n=1 Tax=Parasitella parasitica TaxID=35722 RepID=A0A0B7NDD2_9FUNG|nr:hypothetical protein [Parasitella parasitica]